MKIFRLPYFEQNAGGAQAGAQSGTPGAGQGGAGGPGLLSLPGAQAAAGAQDGPKGYWPEGLSEPLAKLRGVDDRTTIDQLLSEVKGIQRAPEKATDYKLEVPKALEGKLPTEMANDPALAVFRDIAHKNGLSQQQFSNTIAEFYAALGEKGLLPDTIDAKAELAKLMPQKGLPAEREAEALKRLQGVQGRIEGLVTGKTLDAGDAAQLRSLVATAQGVTALEKLFAAMGEHGLQSGGRGAGAISKESLKAEMADPRYDTQSAKYDRAFRERVDTEWRRVCGA